MTGIRAKRYSVSAHKTATCRGLSLLAAIRHEFSVAASGSAAIPETVIIGDRGLLRQAADSAPIAANSAPQQASTAIIIFNNQLNLQQDDQQNPQIKVPSRQIENHS